MNRTQLETCLAKLNVPVLHAKELFKNAYRLRMTSPWIGGSLPKSLESSFSQSFECELPEIELLRKSNFDGSVKFVIRFSDGEKAEMVLMPENNRMTLCVSSQVGCRQGCTFCHTGRMGLVRNVESFEIVGQVLLANKWASENISWFEKYTKAIEKKVTNIVFMGMGEPLDNVEEVVSAVNILSDPWGLGVALKKITISTAGHLEGLKKFSKFNLKLNLAFSIHGTTNLERSQLMPINRKWPLEEVLSWFDKYTQKNSTYVFIQYTIIDNVNDSLDHAKRLIKLLENLKVKVNLIPLNQIDPSRLNSPTPKNLQAFNDTLHNAGMRVMIRYSKGQEIAAACGQLVTSINNQ